MSVCPSTATGANPPQRRLIFKSPAIPLIPATGTPPYIQLWDYAQYQYWLDGENSKLNPEGKSALKATISGNTYKGNVVIYKTHCDWNTASAVTIEDTDVKVVNRNLIVLDGLTENDKVTVTKADGSPITAFNDFDTAVKKGEKYVIIPCPKGIIPSMYPKRRTTLVYHCNRDSRYCCPS